MRGNAVYKAMHPYERTEADYRDVVITRIAESHQRTRLQTSWWVQSLHVHRPRRSHPNHSHPQLEL